MLSMMYPMCMSWRSHVKACVCDGEGNAFFVIFTLLILKVFYHLYKTMENLPIYISVVFGLTTILTIFLFYVATRNSKKTLIILLIWLALQTVIGLSDFYTITNTIPPRFLLLVMPPLGLIIALFATSRGRKYIDNLNLKTLTVLHTIRIPVELVLFWLFSNKVVPELMTFEGRNFDIISGLTAPLIFYFGFVTQTLSKKIVLVWNVICLALLINIVVNAIFSAPFPFQKFAFDQPNVAVLYFPFVWLPSCVVPLVLFSHLTAIRQLLNSSKPSINKYN
jgi:hypothetical protein